MPFATTRLFRRALRIVLVCALSGLPSARAAMLVLVPAGELSAVLESIVAGIRDATDEIDVRTVESADLTAVLGGLDPDHRAVIVLGRKVLEGRDIVVSDVPILLGGFTGMAADASGLPSISLNIDPEYVLEQVEKTGPPIARIRTVLPADAVTAPEVTALLSLEDVAVKNVAFASGERATARAWFETLEGAAGSEEMIWIVDDQHLDRSGTYRYLAESAWREDLLVVSTIPSYARRGVAIGFIPDLAAYGELLVQSVERLIDDPRYTPNPLLGAETVQRVFNRRTLEHVGRRLPPDLDRAGRTDIVIE